MNFIQRVKELNLPLDQFVVIGSGLLDALELRPADDIDLVVSPTLYADLQAMGNYQESVRHDEAYLSADKLEIWQTWGPQYDYRMIKSSSIEIDGVSFINPDLLIAKKRAIGRDKDLVDIKLLEQYQDEHQS